MMKQLFAGAASLATLLGAAPASASAWTHAKGEGQAIVTAVYSHSDQRFDAQGDLVDIADYEKEELYLLLEYGVTDDLTVIASPSYRHVGIEGDPQDTSGLGYTELGARYKFAEGQSWVMSVQGTARIPGERRRDVLAQVGSTDAEYDLRLLGGSSFKVGEIDGFVDLQGGYRWRDGDPPDEFRLDTTIGIRPAPRVQVFAQLFNTFSNGAGEGIFPSYRYHNAYLSAVYDLDAHWSVQLAGLATLSGENALRERGVTVGLWYRLGANARQFGPPPVSPAQ
jgi:opacity protein-like surface antigen